MFCRWCSFGNNDWTYASIFTVSARCNPGVAGGVASDPKDILSCTQQSCGGPDRRLLISPRYVGFIVLAFSCLIPWGSHLGLLSCPSQVFEAASTTSKESPPEYRSTILSCTAGRFTYALSASCIDLLGGRPTMFCRSRGPWGN